MEYIESEVLELKRELTSDLENDYLEAAQLDGASKGQIRRYIILPHLLSYL